MSEEQTTEEIIEESIAKAAKAASVSESPDSRSVSFQSVEMLQKVSERRAALAGGRCYSVRFKSDSSA